MDLGFSDEQDMLRKVARDFLAKECPEALVAAMETDALGYSPDLWARMAELGWQGLAIPEQYGGSGLGIQDLAVLLEEFGRALVPGPFLSTVVHVGTALLLGGSDDQKREYLPRLVSGELVGGVAYLEASGQLRPEGVQLAATPDGDGYVLDGTKLFVENAAAANLLVVAARTGGVGADGLSLFLVDPTIPGVAVTPLETLAGDKQAEVALSGVRVPASALLGGEGQGGQVLARVQLAAAVAECAYLVGLVAQDLDITVDYVKHREQFGRPIGGFQAVAHKAADMVIDVDACRFVMYRAAWALDEDEPDAAFHVSVAKSFISEASLRVVSHGQQLHGGIGFTREYKIHRYFLRQKAGELRWGDGDFHRARVADALGI
ncbi:acyl-CoA/acyl-ACP dehydrogenase [Frankia sp. CNm7]|uniref:Acyl-CoA/acyl-ACP dehydrogenase n=2 Tax=Frankia nepalensis TaxID=1836974 RepID=A0A937RH48_9ACTN|nr:acyl-CoA dehydrogenase family protein [Frankia nepalensis]MBL7499141.1 acyl-CoA/acyl-ACP dehydrogenase [Frankia nepalensis]MBL7511041.1 acyl-CoA/acyl-ACP dehydrogenase [Frankia nepalensis]MBL7520491.1 acyl-CoA/acyl-ACP dehydrogenase [Frankia nepalensis]MBL7632121.1 acyl-CoA/acyl-ACP dehydrogenase [Frankia nepalensis]